MSLSLEEKIQNLEGALQDQKIARAAAERTLTTLAEEFDRVAIDREKQMKRVVYLEGVLHAIYGEAKAVVGVVERLDKVERVMPPEPAEGLQIGLPAGVTR